MFEGTAIEIPRRVLGGCLAAECLAMGLVCAWVLCYPSRPAPVQRPPNDGNVQVIAKGLVLSCYTSQTLAFEQRTVRAAVERRSGGVFQFKFDKTLVLDGVEANVFESAEIDSAISADETPAEGQQPFPLDDARKNLVTQTTGLAGFSSSFPIEAYSLLIRGFALVLHRADGVVVRVSGKNGEMSRDHKSVVVKGGVRIFPVPPSEVGRIEQITIPVAHPSRSRIYLESSQPGNASGGKRRRSCDLFFYEIIPPHGGAKGA